MRNIEETAAYLGYAPLAGQEGVTYWRTISDETVVAVLVRKGACWPKWLDYPQTDGDNHWRGMAQRAQLWAWSISHAGEVEVFGVQMRRPLFELAIILASDGDVSSYVQVVDYKTAIAVHGPGGSVITMGLRPSPQKLPMFPDTVDAVIRSRPAMGAPVPIKWFDALGHGPYAETFISVCVQERQMKPFGRTVDLQLNRVDGAEIGLLSASQARCLAEQLNAAADCAEDKNESE